MLSQFLEISATFIAIVIAVGTLQFGVANELINPVQSEIRFNENEPVSEIIPPPVDPRVVPGKVNERGFYMGPEHCRKPINSSAELNPSGDGNLYTNEDAIIIAKQHCFFDGKGEGSISSYVRLETASSSGPGMAWKFREIDHHATTREKCPDTKRRLTPVLYWDFELNQSTGKLIITEGCAGAIFD